MSMCIATGMVESANAIEIVKGDVYAVVSTGQCTYMHVGLIDSMKEGIRAVKVLSTCLRATVHTSRIMIIVVGVNVNEGIKEIVYEAVHDNASVC